jgi:hypothetical protein
LFATSHTKFLLQKILLKNKDAQSYTLLMREPLADILTLGTELQHSLRDLSQNVGTGSSRVRELTEILGIDKSTASRIVRGLRAESVVGALREFPSGEGLSRFVEACAAGGAAPEIITRADRAVTEFERAVRAMPSGRAGLVAALAGPSSADDEGDATRERAERAARRSAFDAGRFLQGITVDEAVYGLFIGPGSTSDRFDHAMVNAALGVRRLRAGPPITLGAILGSALVPGSPMRVSLSGAELTEDVASAMLPEFCAGVDDRLRVERRGRGLHMWVGESDPPIDKPLSLVYGVRSPNFVERVKSERFHWACTSYAVRRPTRWFMLEVWLHHRAVVGSGPRVAINMEPGRLPDPIGGPPADGRELLETTSRLTPIGRGFTRRGSSRSEAHAPMFRRAMETLGWDPGDFMRYRLEIEYPLAFVEMQVWTELADA